MWRPRPLPSRSRQVDEVGAGEGGARRCVRRTADDHLAAYFRQLAEHELLTPEDERELSQGIEDTEILTWERVLSRAEVVRAPARARSSRTSSSR